MTEHQPTKQVEHRLHLSTIEGMFYGAMQGAGEHFTSAYALALGATNGQLAALVSLPQLMGALSQMAAARLGRFIGHPKRWLLAVALSQDLLWLPILFLGFLTLGDGSAVYWLIAALCLYTICSSLATVLWGGIMADVVPNRIRGRYFGGRSRWGTVANMLAFLGAGLLLYFLKGYGIWGFSLVFGLAFLFRAVSTGLLTTLFEPLQAEQKPQSLSLGAFFGQLFTTNLGKTLLYIFCLSFATNLASPYFTPYMLRNLSFSYLTFTLLEMTTIVGAVLSITHWGSGADRAGNQKMIRITGLLVSLGPLLWLVSHNVFWLAAAQFYSGVVWAGFNLVSVNFIYDATTTENRIAYLGYFNAGAGIAVALGALVGGFVIQVVPPVMGSAILTVFLISSLLRFLTGMILLPQIKEVRRVRTTKAAELFHILLGGSAVHRPSHHGRMHVHLGLHGHIEKT